MNFKVTSLLIFILFQHFLIAQTPVLVQDFNLGELDGFNEFNFNSIQLGEKLIFPIINEDVGEELGVLEDGELSVLKDLNGGENSSNPTDFVAFNDKIYFTATEETNGGGVWRTDGTAEGTELFFATGTSSGEIPKGLIVDDSGFLYFTFDDELYRTDGISTTSIFTGADFSTTSPQASKLHTRYLGEIAFLSKSGSSFKLYRIHDGLPELLGQTPEMQSFVKGFGLHEVPNGLIFGVEKLASFQRYFTFTYHKITNELEEFPIDFIGAERLNGVGDNEFCLAWVRGKGYYFTNGIAGDTHGLFSTDNVVFPNDQPIEHGVFEDDFIFRATEGTSGNDFLIYSDGTAAGTENLFQVEPSISNILVVEKFAFLADGTSNGLEPRLHYVNLEEGSFENIYTFDASFAPNSILLLGLQNNRLYFISNLDSSVGRELYYLDLDFMVGIEEEINNLSNYELKVTPNSFEVAAEKYSQFTANIYAINGVLLKSYDGTTNITYDFGELKGFNILEIEIDNEKIVKKVFIH